MTTPATGRRGRLNLWDTALLLRGAAGPAPSPAPALLLAALGIAAPAWCVPLLARDPSASDRFFVIAGVLIPISTLVTVLFEVRRVAALAFLRTIPQPHPPRALVLLPACGLGLFAALLSLSVLPVAAAVALLGCWCWAAAVGHRFAGRSGWVLLLGAVPLAYIVLFAAAVSFAAAGLTGMAAASPALALVGCFASPRDGFFGLAARATGRDGRRGRGAPEIPSSRNRHVRLRRRTAGVGLIALCANLRASRAVWWSALALGGLGFLPSLLSSPLRGLAVTVGFECMVASGLAASNSRAAREFFVTRPLSRCALLRSTILPWLLLGLCFPTVALVRAATATTVPPGDLRPMSLSGPPDATPAAALAITGNSARQRAAEASVSIARRSSLVHGIVRLALLQQACLFALAAFAIADTRQKWTRLRWICGALWVAAGALMMPAMFAWLHLRWELPPIWLAGALAVAGASALWRRLAVPG